MQEPSTKRVRIDLCSSEHSSENINKNAEDKTEEKCQNCDELKKKHNLEIVKLKQEHRALACRLTKQCEMVMIICSINQAAVSVCDYDIGRHIFKYNKSHIFLYHEAGERFKISFEEINIRDKTNLIELGFGSKDVPDRILKFSHQKTKGIPERNTLFPKLTEIKLLQFCISHQCSIFHEKYWSMYWKIVKKERETNQENPPKKE